MHQAQELAVRSADDIAMCTGVDSHEVAVILGSGWGPAADLLGTVTADVGMAEVAGFPSPSALGHAGRLRSIRCGSRRVLVLLGRTHLYEGLGVSAVAHGVRTAAAAGCRTVVLTNASGGLDPAWSPGTPVLIQDHINLTGESPLRGAEFVDMTEAYSTRLRQLCRDVDPTLTEGVYAQVRGPQYETPAEIGMIRAMGGQLVGMSTAVETIAARACGMEVLGLSLVTNLAAGMSGAPLNHDEVLAAGRAAASRMGGLLAQIIPDA